MERKIPLYFDTVVIESHPREISADHQNMYSLKVRVFTKYKNRNGSYITDEVANSLIESATNGITPVVGFYDPESQSWASHTGPSLANAYGYVEDFLGWEPFQDSDGETRDYAVFSVNLFTEYFEEAKTIIGQNQSMELDPQSITGDWAELEGEYYFIYKTAKMQGFCVIGSHEPCFSAAAFFSDAESQKISSLLFNLKKQVEEMSKQEQGGELPMNEPENVQVTEPETPVVEPEQFAAEPEVTEPEAEFAQEPEVAEPAAEPEAAAEPSEFEILQQKYDELQGQYNEALTRINELEAFQNTSNAEIETLRAENEKLAVIETNYNALIAAQETARKTSLIEKYEKLISEEEIAEIRTSMNDFSYDELEGKLAIKFANAQMDKGAQDDKVPLPEPPESQFALLMKKYRKN